MADYEALLKSVIPAGASCCRDNREFEVTVFQVSIVLGVFQLMFIWNYYRNVLSNILIHLQKGRYDFEDEFADKGRLVLHLLSDC